MYKLAGPFFPINYHIIYHINYHIKQICYFDMHQAYVILDTDARFWVVISEKDGLEILFGVWVWVQPFVLQSIKPPSLLE